MNINYKEAQFEFFPNSSVSPEEVRRPHFLAARLTLSVENLVILAIVSIMILLFSFSLGVERGRKISLNDSPAIIDDKGAATDILADDLKADTKAQIKGEKKSADLKATGVPPNKMRAQSPADKGAPKSQDKASVVALDKTQKVAPLAAPQAQAKPGSGYTIQVASYKTEKTAQKEASTLKQKGFQDVYVLSKGAYLVLCVGSFQKKEEASLFGKKLKGRYQDFVVRRL